jgi:hypothetical protein
MVRVSLSGRLLPVPDKDTGAVLFILEEGGAQRFANPGSSSLTAR